MAKQPIRPARPVNKPKPEPRTDGNKGVTRIPTRPPKPKN